MLDLDRHNFKQTADAKLGYIDDLKSKNESLLNQIDQITEILDKRPSF